MPVRHVKNMCTPYITEYMYAAGHTRTLTKKTHVRQPSENVQLRTHERKTYRKPSAKYAERYPQRKCCQDEGMQVLLTVNCTTLNAQLLHPHTYRLFLILSLGLPA